MNKEDKVSELLQHQLGSKQKNKQNNICHDVFWLMLIYSSIKWCCKFKIRCETLWQVRSSIHNLIYQCVNIATHLRLRIHKSCLNFKAWDRLIIGLADYWGRLYLNTLHLVTFQHQYFKSLRQKDFQFYCKCILVTIICHWYLLLLIVHTAQLLLHNLKSLEVQLCDISYWIPVTFWHILTSSLYPSASALTMIRPTFGISTSETSFSVCLCLTGTSCCCSCCCSSSPSCASCSGASPEASGSPWAGRLSPATCVSSFSSWRSDSTWLLSSASGPGVCKKRFKR